MHLLFLSHCSLVKSGNLEQSLHHYQRLLPVKGQIPKGQVYHYRKLTLWHTPIPLIHVLDVHTSHIGINEAIAWELETRPIRECEQGGPTLLKNALCLYEHLAYPLSSIPVEACCCLDDASW